MLFIGPNKFPEISCTCCKSQWEKPMLNPYPTKSLLYYVQGRQQPILTYRGTDLPDSGRRQHKQPNPRKKRHTPERLC